MFFGGGSSSRSYTMNLGSPKDNEEKGECSKGLNGNVITKPVFDELKKHWKPEA